MKLPVMECVKETYAFVWRERRLFWTLAMPAIILTSLIGTAGSWGLWHVLGEPDSPELFSERTHEWVQGNRPYLVEGLSAMVVVMAVWTVVVVMYMVAWHRAYLLSGTDNSAASAYRWNMRQTRFVWAYVKSFLVLAPVFAFVIWLFAGWFFMRLAPAFPAAAVDSQPSLREAWRLSRRKGWRLFWTMTLATLPATLLAPFQSLIPGNSWEWGGAQGTLTLSLVGILIYNCLWFVGLALGVTALSISYRHLRSLILPDSVRHP